MLPRHTHVHVCTIWRRDTVHTGFTCNTPIKIQSGTQDVRQERVKGHCRHTTPSNSGYALTRTAPFHAMPRFLLSRSLCLCVRTGAVSITLTPTTRSFIHLVRPLRLGLTSMDDGMGPWDPGMSLNGPPLLASSGTLLLSWMSWMSWMFFENVLTVLMSRYCRPHPSMAPSTLA